MSNKFAAIGAATVLATMLTACATPAEVARKQEVERTTLANYIEVAGPELNSFRKMGSTLHSWESLSDDTVILYSRPQQAYLVRIGGGCPGLDFAHAIRVSDSMGTVSRNFDKIYPLDRSAYSQIGCPITSIREVDLQRLKLLQAPFQNARPE